MGNMIDNICKLRDALISKDYNRIVHLKPLFISVFNEMHRHLVRKTKDYNYQLDFTAQDLRELAQDIRSLLKRWETAMSPEKNIKALYKTVKEQKLNFDSYSERVIPILIARRDSVQMLYELLNLTEYHAVFLYFLEIASEDELAIKYTERLVK